MTQAAQLDHAVINTCYDMDSAQRRFEQLGFTLTERGYHTLGSINHLMMFGHDYLELIGLPPNPTGQRPTRPGISDAPLGINGLVFKTSDADATYAHLQSIGLAGDPPNAFSRPVQLPHGSHDARFRTVHVRRDVFPAGRVYFCEHQTPELVWREDLQNHPNGVTAMVEMVVVSENAPEQADCFSRLLQTSSQSDRDGRYTVGFDGAQITITSAQLYRQRYQSLASDTGERPEMFGALVMRSVNLPAARALLATADVPHNATESGVVLRDERFDCVLEFVAN